MGLESVLVYSPRTDGRRGWSSGRGVVTVMNWVSVGVTTDLGILGRKIPLDLVCRFHYLMHLELHTFYFLTF